MKKFKFFDRPLFVTTDGFPIHSHEKFYSVNKFNIAFRPKYSIISRVIPTHVTDFNKFWYFKSKESAQKFIETKVVIENLIRT